MVFFLRLVNIFPSSLRGVSFVLWWQWLFALFVCFWASSVEALQKGPTPGDKTVCVLLCTCIHFSWCWVSIPSQKNLQPQRGSELVY